MFSQESPDVSKSYKIATTRDKTNNIKAGRDFCGESLARKCINIAPIIKMAIPIAEGLLIIGIQIPTISNNDNVILRNPMNFIKDPDRPYTENSSFMFLAFPALNFEGLLNLNIQTLKIPRAIIILIIALIVILN